VEYKTVTISLEANIIGFSYKFLSYLVICSQFFKILELYPTVSSIGTIKMATFLIFENVGFDSV
jgi:hypothetical protein